MNRICLARLLVAALLSGASFAQHAAVVVRDAQLTAADTRETTTTETLLYGATGDIGVSASPLLQQQGSVLNFAGSGPQIRVSQLRLSLISQTAQVLQRVVVKLKFWETYRANAAPDLPVFLNSPPMSEIVVDLRGPFVLQAGTAYMVDASLPKSLLLSGFQMKGVAVQVLGSNGFEEPAPHAELLPGFYTGSVPMAGSILASFGNDGTPSYNFRGDQQVAGKTLALRLYGATQKHTQCATWTAGYRDHLIEEFDAPVTLHWLRTLNGGTTSQQFDAGGDLTLIGAGTGIPYISAPNPASPSVPIPATGEFSVRWLARYVRIGTAGDGMVLSKGLSTGGPEPGPRAMTIWQDNGGFRVTAVTNASQPDPSPVFTAAATSDVTHDIEYCWLSSTVQVWVDGVLAASMTRDANLPRPDSLWIGNPATGFSNWNDLQVFRVHVRRQNPPDTLFYDTFQ
ncbi:MAG: hypothetical protein ABI411_05625 [Tahibacter sp.]